MQVFFGEATCESRLQRAVAMAFRRSGSELDIAEENRDVKSGYSIDILVRRRSAVGSTEWSVGLDGPTHFLRDGRAPSGNTLLKRKQLGQLGYTVVPVPFLEWQALKSEEATRRYLQKKLTG